MKESRQVSGRFGGMKAAVWLLCLAMTAAGCSAVSGLSGCGCGKASGPAIESISLAENETGLVWGQTLQLTASVTPAGADIGKISWTTDNKEAVTVDGQGLVTAAGGGTAVITASAAGGISDSLPVTVDDTRRVMTVEVIRERTDENNIGEEWVYADQINGEAAGAEFILAAGDELILRAEYTEKDNYPDVGEVSVTHTVTEEEFRKGFRVTMELDVTENGGRNKGKSGHFIVTFVFSVR